MWWQSLVPWILCLARWTDRDNDNKQYHMRWTDRDMRQAEPHNDNKQNHMIADVVAIIGTMDIVFGEVDR